MAEQIAAQSGQCLHVTAWACRRWNDGTTHTAATDVPADCGGTCSFSINPTSASFAAAGGSGSVTVSTSAGCNWTAASNNSFITVTSGASGSGNGTVNYSVAAN